MFEKATKKKSKLRLAIGGTPGSGKTYSSLAIGSGLGDKVALIDSENGSASKYSDIFNFDVLNIDDPSIHNYVKAIREADSLGYDVLIIDSITHAWKWLLKLIEDLTNSKYKGNSFRAWAEGTPLQQELVDAILSSKLHIIATYRTKTEYVVEKDDNGKVAPRKVGTKPEQRDGFEYEFDTIFEGNTNNQFHVTKDRTGLLQNQVITKPDSNIGAKLKAWLNTGEDVVDENKQVTDSIVEQATALGWKEDDLTTLIKKQVPSCENWKVIPLKTKHELLKYLNTQTKESTK